MGPEAVQKGFYMYVVPALAGKVTAWRRNYKRILIHKNYLLDSLRINKI